MREGKMMKQLKSSLLFTLIACLLIVSACSSNGKSTNEPEKNEPGQSNNGEQSNTNNNEVDKDPFGKYESAITITIAQEVDPSDTTLAAGDTPLNNQYTRHVKDHLNIDVEHYFTASPSNYDQKVSLAIASNDLPDAMIVGPMELKRLVESDQIEDLTEVFNDYVSPAIKRIIDSTNGIALDMVTFDGKIMAIPNVQLAADGVHLMWIRKDWLDKLELDPPKTVADVEKIAKAFVELDPDGNSKKDTIGLGGPDNRNKINANFLESTNNLFGFDGIFAAYNAYPGYWINDEAGNPVYGSILPETKEALATLRDWYSKGLIDPEMGVREDAGESVVAGKTGMYFAPWWQPYGSIGDAIKSDPEANWQAYALPLNADGAYVPHLSSPTSRFVVVRKGYEHPEAAMKILNNLLANESTFDPSIGGPGFYPLRLVYAPSDETEYSVKALREVLNGQKTANDFADKPEYKLLVKDASSIATVKKEPFDQYDLSTWDPEADRGIWTRAYALMVGGKPLVDDKIEGVYSLTYSQTVTMESRWVNLLKMENSVFLGIIMGSVPIDDFDKFVEDWKKQGGSTITEEVAAGVK